MKIKKIIIPIVVIIIAYVYCVLPANSQQLTIQSSIDKNTLSLDDQLTLRVVVSGSVSNVPKPAIPELKGFTSYSSGRSQNVSIVNGKVSSSVTFTYVLVPQSEGKHIIPAVTVNFKGQTYSTSPIEVEVLASSSKQAPAKTAPSKSYPQTVRQARGNIFVTTGVDKKKVYVNEQIQLTFSFFQSVRLLNQPQYSPADTTGFWTEDLPPQRNYKSRIEGRDYQVVEIKTALFPTSSGKHTIGKANLKCAVEEVSGRRDDFFKGFFSRGKNIALESKPINITVLPLPDEGKPAGFKGAVGQFGISAKVDKTELKTGEAVTLTVDISGSGNVKAISEPVLGNLDNFKRYETVSSFNLSKKDYRVQGSKSYTIVLSPLVSGKLTIPAIRFSYFDPKKKSYRTVKTSPIGLNVKQGERETTSSVVITQEGIKYLTKDILHLKTKRELKDHGNLVYKNNAFVGFHVIPPVVFLGLLLYRRRVEKLSRDVGYARRTRASGMVRKRLKKARELLDTDKTKEFYSALSEGLTKFIGDKLNVPAVGMTMAQIEEILKKEKVEESIIEDVRNVMSRSDFARFAPAELDKGQLKSDYGLSEKIIMKLQKII